MVISTWKEPQVRDIIALRRRDERERTGLFYVEGVRFVYQAAALGASIETLVVAPKMLDSPAGQKIARQLKRSGTPVLPVTPEVFGFLSLADQPQGIGAVVRQQWQPLKSLSPTRESCWIAHDSINSPGNFGTNLRTCDAAGGSGVILLGSSIDPYDPAAVRATMGSIFSQEVVRAGFPELLAWKRRHGVSLIGTSAHARHGHRDCRYRGPVVIYMGCEQGGIPPERLAQCDDVVSIPMMGRPSSLNVAVATGVILFEVLHQLRG